MHVWHSIFDAISDPLCLVDLKGRILRCNQAMASFLNRPLTEIIGRCCHELVHQASEPIAGCPLTRLRITNRCETISFSLGKCSLSVTVYPYRDRSGQLVGAVHTFRDITEQKQLEEELHQHRCQLEELAKERTRELIEANRHLRKSEEMYRRIVETASEGIWIINTG
ncbi:MAG: PAS domain-containing protein, partial [Syntrophomonadaceae bacterium]|nr:PAS domain-containing protein [Syntrophomonadaceae bacterium]